MEEVGSKATEVEAIEELGSRIAELVMDTEVGSEMAVEEAVTRQQWIWQTC